jgi:hypothetical protein
LLERKLLDTIQGADPWPADRALDLATFWAGREPASPPETPWSDDAGASTEQVLARVCALTGVAADDLSRGIHGRRGNPARRFAIWALARDTNLTHKQIGALFRMSAVHVSQTLASARRAVPGPEIMGWISAWGDEEE